jgi:hypothetical protein
MESSLEEMEQRSAEVEQDIEDTSADWERKRADDAVPGAEPRDED